MATSKIKGQIRTGLYAVPVTVVEGAVVGRCTAYLQGNILTLNAVINLTGMSFANNDPIFTINGFKALGWADGWAVSESDRANMLKYCCNGGNKILFSAVAGSVSRNLNGFYDFHITFPVVPA